MKKDLKEAMRRAKEMSIAYPDTTYYVVNKSKKPAMVFSLDWCAMRSIQFDGCHLVAKFKNGKNYF